MDLFDLKPKEAAWLLMFSWLAGPALAESPVAAQGDLRDGLSPKDALAAFTFPEGFRVVQSAAEPDVQQPVAMALDERGRVWVAEAYQYPTRAPGDTGNDRILIFEDKDGDGVFDERKVFAEGLNLVSGLEVGFGGVWVGAAPYLMFIPDRDGDDKPDGKPEILLDGFGWQDTHETLNAFTWGPDGWLYGCHGVFTHSKVGKPGTPDAQRVPMNAAVWRFHPIKKEFELFAQGTSNPWGIDFNDHGQAFITACVVPHLYHVIQGGRYQRQAGQHFDPHTYEDIKTCADHLHYHGDIWANSRDGSSSDLGGGHAHCGLSIYLGDNFPDEYRGKLLFNNLHGHRINQEMVERKGSGFTGKHQPDFVFSNDRQHMGISLKYGPDGGLYLSDWYDSQTCHNPNGETWNRGNGRIYKITYGTPATTPVNLKERTDVELARLQLHRNDWFVRQSRRLLQERANERPVDPTAVELLMEIVAKNPDETRRLRAIWSLHDVGALAEDKLLELTANEGEYTRAWAVQLLVENKNPSPLSLERLKVMAKVDASQLVRLYLAAALQRIPLQDRWEIAEGLLTRPEDAGDANLPLMDWYGVSDLVQADEARALQLAKSAAIPKVRQFLIRRLAESPGGRERLLDFALGNREDKDLLSGILGGMAMAVAKQQGLEAPSKWGEAALLFASLDAAPAKKSLENLSMAFGDEKARARLLAILEDAKAKGGDRTAALAALSRLKVEALPGLLVKLAGDANDPQRAEWILAMGTARNEKTVSFLIEIYTGLGEKEKAAACQALAMTREGSEAVADGLAKSVVKREDISAFAARQMRSYGSPAVDSALEKHWGSISAESSATKGEEINRWKKVLTPQVLAKADLAAGRALFQQTCYTCHTFFGEGMKIGPDLTGSNRKNLDYLLENIIDPNGVIGIDYQLHSVEKNDGQVIAGLLKERNATTLSLAMPGGAVNDIALAEIKRHDISPTSMMPEGLIANLNEGQVRDLVGYLQAENQVELPETK